MLSTSPREEIYSSPQPPSCLLGPRAYSVSKEQTVNAVRLDEIPESQIAVKLLVKVSPAVRMHGPPFLPARALFQGKLSDKRAIASGLSSVY